jgi:hypothetical protein
MVGSGRLDILEAVQFPGIVDQRVGIGSMVFGTTSAVLGDADRKQPGWAVKVLKARLMGRFRGSTR